MNANRTAEELRLEDKETPVCPECGHPEMDTRGEDCPFTYGSGADAVEISVRLPVRKCRKCGFEFFDEEAEDLSHEAEAQKALRDDIEHKLKRVEAALLQLTELRRSEEWPLTHDVNESSEDADW